MKIKQIVAAVFLLVLISSGIQAAELQKLTLQEAISQGLMQNNQVKAAGFQAEAAAAAANAASFHYLPAINFEESFNRSNLPVNTFMMKLNQGRFTSQDFDPARLNNPSPISDFNTSVTVEQPLFVPQAWAAGSAARRGAERQQAVTEQTRQQTAFHIFQLYLNVQKSHARLLAAEKALEEATESKRQALVRTKAGLGLVSDELRADTHLAAMEQQLISADNQLVLSRMQLAMIIGGKSGEEVDVATPVQLADQQISLEELKSLAADKRSDLLAVEKEEEQAKAMLWRSRSAFLPNVGAVGSWQMNHHNTAFGRDRDSWMVGVALRWNIFDGLRSWHNNKEAKAAAAAAGELVTQSRKEVSYQVHEAWLYRQEAIKRHEVASKAVAAAEEATRLLAKRFDNALATMVELLDARTAVNQARADLVDSEAALNQATGQLYHAAGIFLKEVQ